MTIIKLILTIGFGRSLDFFLLSEGIRGVTHLLVINNKYVSTGDELISETLGDVSDVSERGFSGSDSDEVNSHVDSSKGRHIDGGLLDGTSRSNSGGVFSGASIGDGLEDSL